jgi:hypothetical protein
MSTDLDPVGFPDMVGLVDGPGRQPQDAAF